MRLSMGESYPRHIYVAIGLKIFGICLKIDVVLLFRDVKRHLRNGMLCKESPHNLINALGPFSATLQL